MKRPLQNRMSLIEVSDMWDRGREYMTDIRSWFSQSQAAKRAAGERSLVATDVLRNWFISLLDDQYSTKSHGLRQSSVLTITQE